MEYGIERLKIEIKEALSLAKLSLRDLKIFDAYDQITRARTAFLALEEMLEMERKKNDKGRCE